MIEYERKFRIDKAMRESLLKNVANLQEAPILHQIDEVFLYRQSSFKTFKQGDAVLRIRTENGIRKVTYKRVVTKGGDSLEHEFTVNDSHDAVRGMFQDMGYQQVVRIEKRRKEVREKNLTVALDIVEGLGDFIELEVVAESDEFAEESIMSRAMELGLSTRDLEPKKYDRLIMDQQELSLSH